MMYMYFFIILSEIEVETYAVRPDVGISAAVCGGKLGIPQLEFREGEQVRALQIDTRGGHANLLGNLFRNGISQFRVLQAQETHVFLPIRGCLLVVGHVLQ